MADYQIEGLFFSSHARMKARMSKLFHNGYVARLDRAQRAQLPYMAYCLDKRGAEFVASLEGVPLKTLGWRKPWDGWDIVRHDVELNDLRIAAMRALAQLPSTRLVNWMNSRHFNKYADPVQYRDRKGRERTRRIQPDGYFHVINTGTLGERHSRFFIERDRRTEDNPRFFVEKVLPGLAYLRSGAYAARFGAFSARWLVVTTGERRLANMKAHTEHQAAKMDMNARAFYFTTFDKAVHSDAFFTAPIWVQAGNEKPTPLFR